MQPVIRVRTINVDGAENAVAWMGKYDNALALAVAQAREDGDLVDIEIAVGVLTVGEGSTPQFLMYQDSSVVHIDPSPIWREAHPVDVEEPVHPALGCRHLRVVG